MGEMAKRKAALEAAEAKARARTEDTADDAEGKAVEPAEAENKSVSRKRVAKK